MIKKILSLGGATAHRRSASTIGAFSSKDGNAKEDVDLKNECRFLVGISRITGCVYYGAVRDNKHMWNLTLLLYVILKLRCGAA